MKVDGDGCSDFVPLVEVAFEGSPDGVEAGIVPAVDWGGHGWYP